MTDQEKILESLDVYRSHLMSESFRKGWQAAKQDSAAEIAVVTKARDYWQDFAGKNIVENDCVVEQLQADNLKLHKILDALMRVIDNLEGSR